MDVGAGSHGHEGDGVGAVLQGEVDHVLGDHFLGVPGLGHLEGYGDGFGGGHVDAAQVSELVWGLHGSQGVENGLAVGELGVWEEASEVVEAGAGDVEGLDAYPAFAVPEFAEGFCEETYGFEGLPLASLVDAEVFDPRGLLCCDAFVGVDGEDGFAVEGYDDGCEAFEHGDCHYLAVAGVVDVVMAGGHHDV